ncbi:unnamed protein product [Merluccius merluccius]
MKWCTCAPSLLLDPTGPSSTACTLQHLVDINQPCDEAVFGKRGIKHDIVCQSSDRTNRNMSLNRCGADPRPDPRPGIQAEPGLLSPASERHMTRPATSGPQLGNTLCTVEHG